MIRACSILLYIIITICCKAEKLKVTQKYCVCGEPTPPKAPFLIKYNSKTLRLRGQCNSKILRL